MNEGAHRVRGCQIPWSCRAVNLLMWCWELNCSQCVISAAQDFIFNTFNLYIQEGVFGHGTHSLQRPEKGAIVFTFIVIINNAKTNQCVWVWEHSLGGRLMGNLPILTSRSWERPLQGLFSWVSPRRDAHPASLLFSVAREGLSSSRDPCTHRLQPPSMTTGVPVT